MSSNWIVQRTEKVGFQIKIAAIEVSKPTVKKRPTAVIFILCSYTKSGHRKYQVYKKYNPPLIEMPSTAE